MVASQKPVKLQELEPKKSSRQILRHETLEGLHALDRPIHVLFISGLSPGQDIGFSLSLMAIMFTLAHDRLAQYGRFLVWATLGNIVGGTLFVTLIKSGHARPEGRTE